MKRDLKIKREIIKGVTVITLPQIKWGEVMFASDKMSSAIILNKKKKSI